MLLQFCALGVTMSWDDGLLGARASRPHQAWHRPGPSPPLGSTGNGAMALLRPGRCGSRRQGGCLQVMTCSTRRIALKLSGGQRDRMRAGRPRSQGNHSPLEGESQKPSRQAKADAVGGVWRATSQKADLHPLGNSRLPASRAPALPCGSFEEKRPIVNERTTNGHQRQMPPSTTSGTKMLLQFCALGVTSCPWWISFFP